MIVAVLIVIASLPGTAQADELSPAESKVIEKPAAPDLPPLPEPKTESELPPLPEPRVPDEEVAPSPETSDPARSPELGRKPLRSLAPHVRLSLAAGLAQDLEKRATGSALRVSASYSGFLPIIDPQVLLVECLGLPDRASPLALFGAGARVTLPLLGPSEFGLDLAVLVGAHGKLRSQLGAVMHVRLVPTLQAGIFVAHLSANPAAAGILTTGLEVQILLL